MSETGGGRVNGGVVFEIRFWFFFKSRQTTAHDRRTVVAGRSDVVVVVDGRADGRYPGRHGFFVSPATGRPEYLPTVDTETAASTDEHSNIAAPMTADDGRGRR